MKEVLIIIGIAFLVIMATFVWCAIQIDREATQTISGKKTFTTLPESSVVPTSDTQLVNKKYVDDAIAQAIANL